MSAKIQLHPAVADSAATAERPAGRSVDSALSCIRRVQADAEQICTDAADIEDARFIAENIVDACRRVLADGRGGGPLQRQGSSSEGTLTAARPDKARKAAARARLDSLSARELEIFTHLAEGRSAAEIAVVLSRSSKTINNHRTRILQKLELKNATELVRLAVHSGLVSV